MNFKIIIGAVSFLLAIPSASAEGFIDQGIPATREWHVCIDHSKPTSKIYSVVAWKDIPLVLFGRSKTEVESLVRLLSPAGRADVIFYSTAPDGSDYEIELQFSKQGSVSEVSYRKLQPRQFPKSSLQIIEERLSRPIHDSARFP
jgi:hypothetical protein